MSWSEIVDDVWTIPAERYKTKIDHVVPLTDAVQKLLGEPQKAGYVFSSTDGAKPFSGYSKARRALDKHTPGMEHWTLHDLRRTARTLMVRAGVAEDVAERVLGHVISGVRGTYNRHDYLPEKRDARERLAQLVERIVNPADNVRPLRRVVQ
jgi:integrase